MPDRVIVGVDEDLSDLIPGFLTHKRADVMTIFDANARHDYAEIGRIAHRIKGEGGSYGFETMTEMGRSLEHAAAMRDDGAVATLAHQLLNYMDRLEVVFRPSKD
ncbi:Hpt domain-containing protein [Candidatus Binatus sp.]|jgi:HPt (histidine-containing phosphotransfer) domain-containing protein|uniref:Hpt domain-containing protein n=1 Tax=Candidatus Binatus sp. TaxID=2811406 RepID=UPI003BE00C21